MYIRAPGALLLLAASLFAGGLAPAHAQDGGAWLVRTRALYVGPNASSSPSGLDVDGDAVAEVDITYFLARRIGLELVLATAAQEVHAGGSSLGTVNHLPPTLTLQYHFPPVGDLLPYVGAGVNYTNFYSKSGGLKEFELEDSFGLAGQVGADIGLWSRVVFNVDAKYVNIETDVNSDGDKAFHLKINPLLIGAGLGYRL